MRKSVLILMCIGLLGSAIFIANYTLTLQSTSQNHNASSSENTRLLGGDRDEHGCIGSAGYSWCEEKSQCLRPWEEPCEMSVEATVQHAIAEKYNKSPETILITVSDRREQYAKGEVRFTDDFGGAIWFAAKTDTGWELAADGQGPMSCTVSEQYDFPTDMVPVCIDASGQLLNR